MNDQRIGVDGRIWWYIIYDTNWLLTQPPIPPKNTIFPACQRIDGSWEVFAVRYIVPTDVKRELTNLKSKRHDHKQIANARRWLSYLFSLNGKAWESSVRMVDDDGLLARYYSNPNGRPSPGYFEKTANLPLISCAEVDILDIPEIPTEEGGLGADSLTDRQIVSLARMIAGAPFHKNCFIATMDTGIQMEVNSLFYKKGLSIGCLANLQDFTESWSKTYEKIAQSGPGE